MVDWHPAIEQQRAHRSVTANEALGQFGQQIHRVSDYCPARLRSIQCESKIANPQARDPDPPFG
jgi:hypothetical protein